MRTLACGLAALYASGALLAVGCKPGGNGRDDSGTISLDAANGTDAVAPGTDAGMGGNDASIPWPDAGDFDAWTPPPDPGDSGTPLFDAGPADFGPAVIIDTMAVAGADAMGAPIGFDLDGDMTNDNALADLGPFLGMVDDALQAAIDDGTLLLMLEFRAVEFPDLSVDDTMMDAAMYNGVDTDTDPMNNFTGSASFLVDPVSLDAMGYPAILFFNTSITMTGTTPRFYGERNSLPFAFPGLGSIMLVNPRVKGDPTANFGELANAVLGGVIQACALDQVPNPLGGGGTMLELMLGFSIIPDIDVSGDGLETFQLSAGFPSSIVTCTDGDGTVIPNLDPPRCACDERIEDGLSMAMSFHAISAVLTGVAP